jgi:hypothetical protein
MHTDPLVLALSLAIQQEAQERARAHRAVAEARAAERTAPAATAPRARHRRIWQPVIDGTDSQSTSRGIYGAGQEHERTITLTRVSSAVYDVLTAAVPVTVEVVN